jgi:hypothetical protein
VKRTQTPADKFDQKLFDAIYSRSLVYNTSEALRFHPERARELTRLDRRTPKPEVERRSGVERRRGIAQQPGA